MWYLFDASKCSHNQTPITNNIFGTKIFRSMEEAMKDILKAQWNDETKKENQRQV